MCVDVCHSLFTALRQEDDEFEALLGYGARFRSPDKRQACNHKDKNKWRTCPFEKLLGAQHIHHTYSTQWTPCSCTRQSWPVDDGSLLWAPPCFSGWKMQLMTSALPAFGVFCLFIQPGKPIGLYQRHRFWLILHIELPCLDSLPGHGWGICGDLGFGSSVFVIMYYSRSKPRPQEGREMSRHHVSPPKASFTKQCTVL